MQQDNFDVPQEIPIATFFHSINCTKITVCANNLELNVLMVDYSTLRLTEQVCLNTTTEELNNISSPNPFPLTVKAIPVSLQPGAGFNTC